MKRREFIEGLGAAALLAGCSTGANGGRRLIRFASWNIGHYALGRSNRSTIRPEDGKAMGAKYREFLDGINADILGVCEYSDKFTTDGGLLANEAVFGRYAEHHIGPANSYQWNACFWNGFRVLERKFFDYPHRNQKTYCLLTRLDLGGVEMAFVQTHLDWNIMAKGHANDRADQIRFLIDTFKDEKRVLIAGDFNTTARDKNGKGMDNPVEFQAFRRQGYTLGNDGRFKTCPSGSPSVSIDNIIVRGVGLSDFAVHDRADLSDHALISATIEIG